ncbi:MAG: hypothetical protein H7123_10060, partial [Thermoleophilia bacterium]|nr:hypothetical protein [Thermoleophilia bacterium]
MSSASTHVRRASPRGDARIGDPFIAGSIVTFVALFVWFAAPLATGATSGASTNVGFEIKSSLAVAPSLSPGDKLVRLGDLTAPGQQRDAVSNNWTMTTNWSGGYEVLVRSTTAPALRGRNATDGDGASDAFQDFLTGSACPCPWDIGGFSKGVFGYSATVTTQSGPAAVGSSKWGTSGVRKWRGFNNTDYLLYETNGGVGAYGLDLNFRTA